MEIYRVTKDSPAWQKKAYDYVRTDAFVFGQDIPIETEFSHDDPDEELLAVLIVDDHKPIAGCRITYPRITVGKIGRVCVVREKQKSGVGRVLIAEAEKWIKENGANRIVISSQDRAQGFYEKVGYHLNPDEDPHDYEKPIPKTEHREPVRKGWNPGFKCVLVEKSI